MNPTLLRRTAMNLLARREHSEAELLKKLRAKKFPDSLIQPLLQELNQQGLLSNQRFVEMYVRSRRNKGYGPLRIQAELHERGIPEDLIEQYLDITDNAWLIEAERVWRKHFRNKSARDFKEQAKQMRFLQYRGFTPDQIRKTLKEAEGCL